MGSIGKESCRCKAGTYESNGICLNCTLCSDQEFYDPVCSLVSNSICEKCRLCKEWEYEKTACQGVVNRECLQCHACAEGIFMSSSCGGTDPNPVCSRCRMCGVDFYASAWTSCDGTLSWEGFAVCQRCRPAGCGVGTYIYDRCSGETTHDTTLCVSCRRCARGHYYSSGCDGSSYNNSHTCSPCPRCPAGMYIQNTNGCDGAGTVSVYPDCEACTPCPNGFVHRYPCDGSSFSDTCVPCPSCQEGFYIDSSAGTCTCVRCNAFQYQGNDTCSMFERMTGEQCSGTSTYDQTCEACEDCKHGSFKEHYCNGAGHRLYDDKTVSAYHHL